MAKRILTSAVGLVLFFGVLFAGDLIFSIGIFVVTLAMLIEMHRAMQTDKIVFAISLVACAVLTYSLLIEVLQVGLIIVLLLYLVCAVFRFGKVQFQNIYTAAFTTLFITLFMTMVSMIRQETGIAGALLVFVCAWITDSGAYFTGYFLGKRKLVPQLSPKKTVEGAIGGVVSCMVSCIVYLAVLQLGFGAEFTPSAYLWIAVLGVVASVFAQLGDLTASAVKRDCGVKDFGYILPGHGGVMDRFDSVVFIAPLIYYILFYTNIF